MHSLQDPVAENYAALASTQPRKQPQNSVKILSSQFKNDKVDTH